MSRPSNIAPGDTLKGYVLILRQVLTTLFRSFGPFDSSKIWRRRTLQKHIRELERLRSSRESLLLDVTEDSIQHRGLLLLGLSGGFAHVGRSLKEAGVTTIEIHRGVSVDELVALSEALINSTYRPACGSEDLVTAFGSLELDTIHFTVDPWNGLDEGQSRDIRMQLEALDTRSEPIAKLAHLPATKVDPVVRSELTQVFRHTARDEVAAQSEVYQVGDQLREEMIVNAERLSRCLAPLIAVSGPSEKDRIEEILQYQVLHEAVTQKQSPPTQTLRNLIGLMDSGELPSAVLPLLRGSIEGLAEHLLLHTSVDNQDATDLAGLLHESEYGPLLEALLEYQSGRRHSHAIGALVSGRPETVRAIHAAMDMLEPDVLCTAMRNLQTTQDNEEARALFRDALCSEYLPIRTIAQGWFTYQSVAHAPAVLAVELRSEREGAQLSALWLCLRNPAIGAELLRGWMEDPAFLEQSDRMKKLVVRAFAFVEGKAALPLLRSMAQQSANGINGQGAKAAAIAGLGEAADIDFAKDLKFLVDHSLREDLGSIEARHVLRAFSQKRRPYPPVTGEIREQLTSLGLMKHIEEARDLRTPQERLSSRPQGEGAAQGSERFRPPGSQHSSSSMNNGATHGPTDLNAHLVSTVGSFPPPMRPFEPPPPPVEHRPPSAPTIAAEVTMPEGTARRSLESFRPPGSGGLENVKSGRERRREAIRRHFQKGGRLSSAPVGSEPSDDVAESDSDVESLLRHYVEENKSDE
ncbi:MAG: hypothetical protein AAF355_11880 [Myxococcota bacterium]